MASPVILDLNPRLRRFYDELAFFMRRRRLFLPEIDEEISIHCPLMGMNSYQEEIETNKYFSIKIIQKGLKMAGQDKAFPISNDLQKVSDETILKIAKEITVKFIEVGRVTPTTFPAAFTNIYTTIDKTVRGNKL